MTPAGVEFSRLVREGKLRLPPIGGGETAQRWDALVELARTAPLSVARLAEAHVDAMAILGDADCRSGSGASYGVWASHSTSEPLMFDPASRKLSGTKRFCGGAGIVERALVSARTSDGQPALLDVAVLVSESFRVSDDEWTTLALSETSTGTVVFERHPVESVVGVPGWYLDRPGFWHGACGPAACWAGGAAGLVDAASSLIGDDPHRRAHHGAMVASMWAMRAMLAEAGNQIDSGPTDRDAAEQRARSLRWVIERMCTDILDRFSRAFGPRPFVGDAAIAHRVADLHLYLRQHHAERELGALSAIAGG